MGEARRRGTFEERRNQAVERKQLAAIENQNTVPDPVPVSVVGRSRSTLRTSMLIASAMAMQMRR